MTLIALFFSFIGATIHGVETGHFVSNELLVAIGAGGWILSGLLAKYFGRDFGNWATLGFFFPLPTVLVLLGLVLKPQVQRA